MVGIMSTVIANLAETVIRLFIIGYLFMAIYFIYLTYFHIIVQIKLLFSIMLFIVLILLIIILLILHQLIGVNGVWLAIPIVESIVTFVLLYFVRFKILSSHPL